ncbi:hypothetical protein [Nonlabens dokdonensis]|nr:hypothetical protein [Nonlabens dokdonensis]
MNTYLLRVIPEYRKLFYIGNLYFSAFAKARSTTSTIIHLVSQIEL